MTNDTHRRRGIYAFSNGFGWCNQQLTKNCGLVPYLFHKLWGWRAVMVGVPSNAGETYPALADVPGLELDLLPQPVLASELAYLEAHRDDIDVLVLHGLQPLYFPLARRYRQLRPDGKIYLETDANSFFEDRIPVTDALVAFLRSCDVVGASCHKMQEWLSTKWPCCIDYQPNGFYDVKGVYRAPSFAEKENVILTVGRLGTEQKQTDVLLRAFARAADACPGWRLELVGSIAPEFETFQRKFFVAHPALKGRVTFSGPIQDKAQLLARYARAKIFALPSLWEGGTPNVIAEALYGGCYILCSGIDAADDATDGGRCGRVHARGDVRGLARDLVQACNDPVLLADGGRAALAHGRDAFDFVKLVRRLRYRLFGEGDFDGRDFA